MFRERTDDDDSSGLRREAEVCQQSLHLYRGTSLIRNRGTSLITNRGTSLITNRGTSLEAPLYRGNSLIRSREAEVCQQPFHLHFVRILGDSETAEFCLGKHASSELSVAALRGRAPWCLECI